MKDEIGSMKYKKHKKRTSGVPCSMFHVPSLRGFTLIEMMVAFAIFAVIMVVAVGSLLSLIRANYKAQTTKTVVNNLHFALENMSRNIRTGTGYHCGGSGDLTVARDCTSTAESQFVFKSRDGSYVMYRLFGGSISRSKSSDTGVLVSSANFIPITAPEVQVDTLSFYVDGADRSNEPGNNKEQPRVFILVKGSMLGKNKFPTRFDIQTLVSQRLLDI